MNESKNIELFGAIQTYLEATLTLGKIMAEVKEKHGRKALEDITLFDLSRINTLCRLGNCNLEDCKDLLPEHICELPSTDSVCTKKYRKAILESSLKPSQLRKYIRKQLKSKEAAVKEKPVKVNKWYKHTMLLENDLKSMDVATKQRALAFLTNAILAL